MEDKSGGWSLLNQLHNDLGAPSSSKAAPGVPGFLPSAKWQGQKRGYFFSRGPQGQGYYLDGKQAAPSPEEVADDAEGSGAQTAAPRALTGDELLRQAEEQAHVDEIQTLDARGVRRLVATLEKKYKENLEARLKHPDSPEKFLDSEVDLDETVKGLMQVAGTPDLYPVLVDCNPFPTLLACVGHENTDIVSDTLEVLRELTDADAVEEYGEEVRGLVGALVDANALDLLTQRLTGFNEKVEEDAKAVFNCLNLFENMVEVDPRVGEQLVHATPVLKWLLTRLKGREFDGNKLEASELLAVLMQGSETNQTKLREVGGMDGLLQAVAPYKSKDPASSEEEELMQNCFDVLCSLVMSPEGKAAFMAAEGTELMWIMLTNRKQCRYGALRLLDFACTRFAPPCERLVDLGGLKHVFGAFMGKTKIRGPKGERDAEHEVEERCVSLIASMMGQLGPTGGRRERLASKFVESEFEKSDRLMEIFFRYQEKVGTCEMALAQREEEEGEELEEDDVLSERMDAGLFTLQQVALIAGLLWATGDPGLRKRLLSALHLKSQSLGAIREVLAEYYTSVGDEGALDDSTTRLLARIREALLAVGATAEEVAALRGGAGPEGPAAIAGDQAGSSKAAGASQNGRARDADDMEMEVDEQLPPGGAAAGPGGGTDDRSSAQPVGGGAKGRGDASAAHSGEDRGARATGVEGGSARDGGRGGRDDKGSDRGPGSERERDRGRHNREGRDTGGREREARRSRSRSRSRERAERAERDREGRRRDDRRRSRSRSRERREERRRR